jgi:hypothetical protein
VILNQVAHRPYAVPNRAWVMAQTWEYLLFMHWVVPAEALQKHLPAGLALDTFAGQAWLGVVPFLMTHVRLRGLPPIAFTSRFPELNVRTYVVRDGVPGVWFFSLDAGNPLAVAIARRTFHLPYFNARMSITVKNDTIIYQSQRTHPNTNPADFAAQYRPISDIFYSQPATLDHWLTERYALYAADSSGRLYRGHIQHVPWSLQRAEATLSTNTMASATAAVHLPDTPPRLHYVRRLDVLAWALERC